MLSHHPPISKWDCPIHVPGSYLLLAKKSTQFMISATNPNVDYKALVRQAYDACAAAYDASRKTEPGFEMRALSDID